MLQGCGESMWSPAGGITSISGGEEASLLINNCRIIVNLYAASAKRKGGWVGLGGFCSLT